MNIPFVDLKSQYISLKAEIDNAINNVITETAFIGGKYVEEFERSFAKAYGVDHCISCANGTDSLYIIMKMLGITSGHEVITVANSWISTSETISQTGAKPVFVDCDPVYYTIDEQQITKKITSRTKAIIPVHLFGQMCNMEPIMEIAKKHSLFVIEDCAQSHFSKQNGINAGLFGIASSFSFYPGKNLGAYGDAGAIITKDPELAKSFKMFGRHGALIKHQHMIEGINSRMDGLQAAILNVKLKRMGEWTKARQDNSAKISGQLSGVGDLVLPKVRINTEHSFHLYVIQTNKRDQLAAYLKGKGIETSIHYPVLLPLLTAYQYLGYTASDFPVSSKMSNRILSLPLYPELNDEAISYMTKAIKDFFS